MALIAAEARIGIQLNAANFSFEGGRGITCVYLFNIRVKDWEEVMEYEELRTRIHSISSLKQRTEEDARARAAQHARIIADCMRQ